MAHCDGYPLGLKCITTILVGHGNVDIADSDDIKSWIDKQEENKKRLRTIQTQERFAGRGSNPQGTISDMNRSLQRPPVGLPEFYSPDDSDSIMAVSCHREVTNKRLRDVYPGHGVGGYAPPVGTLVDIPETLYDSEKPGKEFEVKADEDGQRYLTWSHEWKDKKLKDDVRRYQLLGVALRYAIDSAVKDAKDTKCISPGLCKDAGCVSIRIWCAPNVEDSMKKIGLFGECGKSYSFDCKTGQVSPALGAWGQEPATQSAGGGR